MTNLAYGPRLLAIPGPTTVPDRVLRAMHRPAIDIYAGELEAITATLLADLKTLFRAPDGAESFLYIANGHGGWEAALANTLSRGDKILALDSGRFCALWAGMAAEMGIEAEVLPGRPRGGVDPEAVVERLRQDRGGEIKAVLAVQIDTASGAWSDIAAIREAIDLAGHEALYMVDAVASVGCTRFEMAGWGVDVALTGSQKGLMTPPGLAPMVAGARALEAASRADLNTRYWDWRERLGAMHYQKYCGTPPEHLLFGLREAMNILLKEEGLEASWARHQALADATRAAVAAWAEGGAVEMNILDPAERSNTVTPIRVGEGCDAEALRRASDTLFGVTLGFALGGHVGPGGGLRLAHMGHASAASVMATLGAAEAAMRALGWPLGPRSGIAAAAESLGAAARASL